MTVGCPTMKNVPNNNINNKEQATTTTTTTTFMKNINKKKKKQSWGAWIADCLGIDIQFSTSTTRMGPDGRPITSRSSTHYGSSSSSSNRQRNQNQYQHKYTSQSTQTTFVNGQRYTIQSLEKDGNRIEEHYNHENQLVQRLINGLPDDQSFGIFCSKTKQHAKIVFLKTGTNQQFNEPHSHWTLLSYLAIVKQDRSFPSPANTAGSKRSTHLSSC